jgi:hypothetical protein
MTCDRLTGFVCFFGKIFKTFARKVGKEKKKGKKKEYTLSQKKFPGKESSNFDLNSFLNILWPHTAGRHAICTGFGCYIG